MARKKAKTLEENEFNRAVGKRLERLRRKSGLTQAQLAYWGGVSDAQLGYYENGSARCPVFRLSRFAARMRVEITALIPNSR